MCATQTRTQARPAARACGWVAEPFDLPAGGRLGFLYVRVGRRTDYYRVRWLDADDMAAAYEVARELPDGTFAEPYRVSLPAPGGWGAICSCPGWRHGGTCRHVAALAAALARVEGRR